MSKHDWRIAIRGPKNDNNGVDDVTIRDVYSVHFEQTDNDCFWLCAYLDEDLKDKVIFHFYAKDNKVLVRLAEPLPNVQLESGCVIYKEVHK